ncbi:MAG TPA: replication protein RepA [Candidatus Eisenbacteria bacterium]|nr:replication protein RepA [Candidatus Eisenbacteria bacterium]
MHYETPVPFGQDRLIPIWVATLAIRQRSRTVHFSTAAEMLDFFRLFKDGKRYHRIMEGFQRIFAATIFFGTSDQPGAKLLLDWARFHFFDRVHLWFHHDEPATATASSAENLIVLSEAFYDEIDQHRIPVEREVIALLANAPGVLDLYVWLVWKTWTLNGQCLRIPLFGTGGLSEQLGTDDYSANRFFRRKIRRWLREVTALWPECPASISADGQSLILHSAKQNPAVVAVKNPVHA